MNRKEEFILKVKKIRGFMDKKGYRSVFFGTQPNFSWLSCGGDNQIIHGAELGFVQFLITPEKVYLISNNIEMPRIIGEEIDELEVEKLEYIWTEGKIEKIVREISGDGKIASDFDFQGAVNEAFEIGLLRVPLIDSEIKRYRELAKMCESAMNQTMKEIEPGMDEYEIQGIIGEKLLSRGIYPVVLLVGTDRRIFDFRHPMPTSKKLEKYCMVVICALKWGMILNMTRLVHFGPLPDEIKSKYEALHRVDMAYITATRAGKTLKEVFNAGKMEYREVGYEGEETKHFQGGTCGYLTREQGLDPFNGYKVQDGEIFAHNPTIKGTKIEDSIYVKNEKYEILTLSSEWPSREITYKGVTLRRPEILIR